MDERRAARPTTAATTRAACAGGRGDRLRRVRAPAGGLRAEGRYVGVGLSSFVERTGYRPRRSSASRGSRFGAHESVTLRANRAGGVDLYTGVSTFGQGTETRSRRCARGAGLDPGRLASTPATRRAPFNTGAFASRTMIAGAGAIEKAAARSCARRCCGSPALARRRPGRGSWRSSGVDPPPGRPRARGSRSAGCTSAAINGQGLPGRGPGSRRRRTSSRRQPRSGSAGPPPLSRWIRDRRFRDRALRDGARLRHAREPDASRARSTAGSHRDSAPRCRRSSGTTRTPASSSTERCSTTSCPLRPICRPSSSTTRRCRRRSRRSASAASARWERSRPRPRSRTPSATRWRRRRGARPAAGHTGVGLARARRRTREGGADEIQQTFTVAALPRVWEFFEDIERVARCVPGVQSVDVLGPDRYKVLATQKVGFISATFEMATQVESKDPLKSLALSSVGKTVKGAIGNLLLEGPRRLRGHAGGRHAGDAHFGNRRGRDAGRARPQGDRVQIEGDHREVRPGAGRRRSGPGEAGRYKRAVVEASRWCAQTRPPRCAAARCTASTSASAACSSARRSAPASRTRASSHLDTSAAAKVPGVRAIVTGRTAPAATASSRKTSRRSPSIASATRARSSRRWRRRTRTPPR